MSIQANINQGISLAGLLLSQTPMAAAQREKVAEEQRARAEQRQADKDVETYENLAEYGIEPETEAEAAVQSMIAEKGAAAYERQFELNPITKTYKKYTQALEAKGYYQREQSRLSKSQETKNAAADAGEAEAARIAESRRITKMITEGIPLSPASEKYVNKRLGGNQ